MGKTLNKNMYSEHGSSGSEQDHFASSKYYWIKKLTIK